MRIQCDSTLVAFLLLWLNAIDQKQFMEESLFWIIIQKEESTKAAEAWQQAARTGSWEIAASLENDEESKLEEAINPKSLPTVTYFLQQHCIP